MTVGGEPTYGQKILQQAWGAMQPAIDAARIAAEKRTGKRLKIEEVSLVAVAQEQREVYDVVVTMVPDPPAAGAQPPEAASEPSV